MNMNKTRRVLTTITTLVILFSMVSSAIAAPAAAMPKAPSVPVTFTILHTNDFHGQLEPSGSNPGMARVANYVNGVRTAVGETNVILVDAGDEMQGSLLSNLGDGTPTGKGKPTIATYNAMGYDIATFGNHEFDWGQVNLGNRTTEADYPYVTANIVQNDTGNCATASWVLPAFADAPYQIQTIGTPPNAVKVAFIGVTTTETPTITVSTATAGLCFKDPTTSILHYYDEMKAAGADVIVVLSHLGYPDGGYGYGLPVYGDQTMATQLNAAGKPVNLIIGGHSHTNLASATTVGTTKIVQAYYNGRRVGRADVTVGTDGSVAITWTTNTIATTDPQDPTINSLISGFASDPAYLAIVNQPIGYSAVDLPRTTGTAGNGNVDNMMGTFIDDAIYKYLNTDAEPTNDIDIFFNNAGGIRADWCYDTVSGTWISTGCVAGLHTPALLTYGNMFTVLPFGNATVVGQMTGAQILQVVNYGPNVAGVIQPAGLKYSYYKYSDALPGPQPYAWGAYDVTVYNKVTHAYEPLDLKKTYRVGTNEFLAPAGGDGYSAFKYMTNITYWGDMLNAVNAYVSAHYGTVATAYAGPYGNGNLDGRIGLNGDGDTTYDAGEIVPLTILHHNDMHGNLPKTSYVGYTQLAYLIKQERAHNASRTLLLNGGDDIQGDAMMYYFKSAPSGKAADGTDLPPALQTHPMMAVMNSMNYDAMVLGNHEFNFGSTVFKGIFQQANFHILGANVTDSGAYGLSTVGPLAEGVQPYLLKTVGPENIKVAILGITNHRVPNYELPSNIPGLTFSDPLAKAQELSTTLRSTNDVMIALTHIGFTENPSSVEVDSNVDTNMAATVTGLDAIIGSHSHTDPSKQTAYSGVYKFLPTIVADPNDRPVVVTQAYRYNNYLGEVVMGLRSDGSGGYNVVSETGRYLAVTNSTPATAEDGATKLIVDPYVTQLNAYNSTVVGQTTAPIDTLLAFTQETNGANLQADASVYELSTKHGIPVDFHLSGAMTNKLMASSATPATPVTLTIADMFGGMPYENSLLVISMNGPQLKTILERAYRNYYYYKYVPGYGGYSYYTTCMIDTNFGNQIKYNDLSPALPNGHNVVSLTIGGVPVDFNDASTYYNVSTVNYLAAGSCNFNDAGVSLWPLNQIVQDTQYYVRDAVIDYIAAMTPVSPAIEGRLQFVSDPTVPTVDTFAATSPINSFTIPVTAFTASDNVGVTGYMITESATPPAVIDTGWSATAPTTYTVAADGTYTLYPWAKDGVGNVSAAFVAPSTVVVDTTAPVVDTLTATTPTNSLNIPITAFTASDVVGVTGYMITESATAPAAGAAGWTATAPTTYTVASAGAYTLYPWAKDAVGNVSAVFGTPLAVVVDTTAPTVNTFAVTTPVSTTDIPVTAFTASDSVGPIEYLITESAIAPAAGDAGWSGTVPTIYSVAGPGTYTLYPWAKDAAGNVSTVFGTPRTVLVNANLEVFIAGLSQGTYAIPSGGSTRESYALVNDGPVKVVSTGAPILAAQRILYYANGLPTSFVETMGLPAGQLGTTYWFPWYKNDGIVDTQLRIGNVSGSTATVHIYIAGLEVTGSPFTLTASGAGQSQRLSFALNGGPVKVVSDQNIVTSERLIYFDNGVATSFSEVMGLPNSQLSKTYWFPWYKNVGEVDTQLRIANVSGTAATVHVYIGGVEMTGSPFTLAISGAGQSVRLSFAANNGPVKIVSDQNIIASERILYYAGGAPTSLVEMMGLPDSQLGTTHWFPWYKNDGIVDTQLRIGNVSGTTASVHVYIGGVEMTGSPFSLTATGAGQSLRLSFPVNDGPVKIVSDQNIVTSERLIYFFNGVPTSFSEMMGLPDSQKNATYWLPWYKNVGEIDTQLRFGVPQP